MVSIEGEGVRPILVVAGINTKEGKRTLRISYRKYGSNYGIIEQSFIIPSMVITYCGLLDGCFEARFVVTVITNQTCQLVHS